MINDLKRVKIEYNVKRIFLNILRNNTKEGFIIIQSIKNTLKWSMSAMMLKGIVKISKNGFYKRNGDCVELKAQNLVKI